MEREEIESALRLKEAYDVVIDDMLKTSPTSVGVFIRKSLLKKLTSDQIEKISSARGLDYKLYATLAGTPFINDKTALNIKRNTSSREVYIAAICNRYISIDVRKKFLTKSSQTKGQLKRC